MTTSQGVKSAAQDWPGPHAARPAGEGCIPISSASGCLSLSATLHGYGLWDKLHVLCGMICNFLVPPALTVLLGSAEEKLSCVQMCVCSLKIFGQ